MIRSKYTWQWVTLLIVAWGLLTIQIDAPFFGHHDANGVWISAAARNWRLYGIDQTGLVPVVNRGIATPQNFIKYVNHPPLIVYAVALSTLIFGENEVAARLIPAFCTLISIAAFYVLIRRLWDVRIAWWAAAFFAFTPMLAYFGRMPNHEAPALMFILLFAAVLARWMIQPNRVRWCALALLTVCGVWTAWAATLVIGCLGFTGLIMVRGRSRKLAVVALGIVGVVAMAALLIIYETSSPGAVERLINAFSRRASSYESFYNPVTDFTAAQWIIRQISDVALFFTPGVLILGVIGIAGILRRGTPIQRALTLALTVAALIYVLVLRNAVYEHDFYKIYFAPALAAGSAAAFSSAWHQRRLFPRLVLMLTVLSAAISIIFLLGLHQFAARAQIAPLQIVNSLRQISVPEDKLQTNIQLPIGVGYYSFRNIQSGFAPEDADFRERAIYLYCGEMTAYSFDASQIAADGVCTYWRRTE